MTSTKNPILPTAAAHGKKLMEQVSDALRTKSHSLRAIQELLGHNDVKTTLIYTHVLQRGGLAVKSPLDV